MFADDQSESHFCLTEPLCSSNQWDPSSIVGKWISTYLATHNVVISRLQSGNGQYTDSIGPEPGPFNLHLLLHQPSHQQHQFQSLQQHLFHSIHHHHPIRHRQETMQTTSEILVTATGQTDEQKRWYLDLLAEHAELNSDVQILKKMKYLEGRLAIWQCLEMRPFLLFCILCGGANRINPLYNNYKSTAVGDRSNNPFNWLPVMAMQWMELLRATKIAMFNVSEWDIKQWWNMDVGTRWV